MATMAELTDRLKTARQRLDDLRPAVEAGVPWPLSANFGTAPEAVWGPPETLAHVAEMLPYWLGEAERILAGGPEPVPFGRVADDELRILTIKRDRTLPMRELYDRIAGNAERYERRLAELSQDDVHRVGLHPTRGELTVADMLERFAVGHLEEHVRQLEAAIETARAEARRV